MAVMDFEKLFHQFTKIKVAVVGDVMLDTYWWGRVERISPEAPVPVVAVNTKEQRIGGAGNVALNLQSLGAAVSVISVLGKDDDGAQLTQLLNGNNINKKYSPEPGAGVGLVNLSNQYRILAGKKILIKKDESNFVVEIPLLKP